MLRLTRPHDPHILFTLSFTTVGLNVPSVITASFSNRPSCRSCGRSIFCSTCRRRSMKRSNICECGNSFSTSLIGPFTCFEKFSRYASLSNTSSPCVSFSLLFVKNWL